MNRIEEIFAGLRRENRRAIMPFACGGFPAPGSLAALLPALERAGASIVEIGFPFSDPIADGPVIAAAMHEALQKGATPGSVLEEIAAVRARVSLGLVAMVSVSIVWRMGGPQGFVAKAADAGFDGFIFPDVTFEESTELRRAAAARGCTASLLVAPTTAPKRAQEIAQACTGFVYLLARTGITGERQDAPEIGRMVANLRQATDLPIACGFGIASADHVRAVVRHADAAIVGSALVRRMADAANSGRDAVAEAESFTRDLARGLEDPAAVASAPQQHPQQQQQ
ncbi:MAG: tryptophan synthase subunit alpha [Phycisphaerales bacterium]|nr:tryptophan synthase subunit alpha [Phycisphaerales bacterium]